MEEEVKTETDEGSSSSGKSSQKKFRWQILEDWEKADEEKRKKILAALNLENADWATDHAMQLYFVAGVVYEALSTLSPIIAHSAAVPPLDLFASMFGWNTLDSTGGVVSASRQIRKILSGDVKRHQGAKLREEAMLELLSSTQLMAASTMNLLSGVSPYYSHIPHVSQYLAHIAIGGATGAAFATLGGFGFAAAMWIYAARAAFQTRRALKKTDLMYMFEDRIIKIEYLEKRKEKFEKIQGIVAAKDNTLLVEPTLTGYKLYYQAKNTEEKKPLDLDISAVDGLAKLIADYRIEANEDTKNNIMVDIKNSIIAYTIRENKRFSEDQVRLKEEAEAIAKVKLARTKGTITRYGEKSQKKVITESLKSILANKKYENAKNYFNDFSTKLERENLENPSRREEKLVQQLEKNRWSKVYEKATSVLFWTLSGVGMTCIALTPFVPPLLIPGIVIAGVGIGIRIAAPKLPQAVNYFAKKQLVDKLAKEMLEVYSDKKNNLLAKLDNLKIDGKDLSQEEKLKWRIAYEASKADPKTDNSVKDNETLFYKELLSLRQSARQQFVENIWNKYMDNRIMLEVFGKKWHTLKITDAQKEKIVNRHAREKYTFFKPKEEVESNGLFKHHTQKHSKILKVAKHTKI